MNLARDSGQTCAIFVAQMKQEIMGFGSAMTDTSAYNAMVWMDEKTRAKYFEALSGASGLGLSIGRCTAPGCKVSFMPPLPACLFM